MVEATLVDQPLRLLLVDDEPRLTQFLGEELEEQGYDVRIAGNLATAWERLQGEPAPELVVLDWSLPDGSGPELCARMREEGLNIPVLMLTGHDEVSDRVMALDSGVDDYLVKPFSVDELLARLRALQRRRWEAEQPKPDEVLVLGGLSLNLTAETASLAGADLPLLRKEYDLLVELLRADGKPYEAEALLLNLWGEAGLASPTILDVYVESVQQKLSSEDSSPCLQSCTDQAWRLLEDGGVSS